MSVDLENAIAILFLLFVVAIIVGIAAWVVDSFGLNYHYNNEIGSYFELSDKASTIDTKLEYLEKYEKGLLKYGLDKGQSTMNYQTSETDLSENYKVLLTLKERLKETKNLPKNSDAYQWAIKQITEEYCWFHQYVFMHGFYIKMGRPWFSLFPGRQQNNCAMIGD
jgi:hypothetical protein